MTDLQEIKTDVKDIKKILNGNGQIGVVAKVEYHELWIQRQKSKRDSIVNFVYRAVIAVVVGYIAIKVGLK